MHSVIFKKLLIVGTVGFTPGVRRIIPDFVTKRKLSLTCACSTLPLLSRHCFASKTRSLQISVTGFIRNKMSNPSPLAASRSFDPTDNVIPGKDGAPCHAFSQLAMSPDKEKCDKVLNRYNNITKSQGDKREYRGLELKNKLRVLLVSDSTTDKSAAAVNVNVGLMSDPDEVPGIAHFCEHMLFVGTEKYPEENAYSKFLSENGGSSNACTMVDNTNFYFDVIPEKLAPALEIFSQFFISPLFTSNMTDRELNAVDSEHSKNLLSDAWRLDQLSKSNADPNHPYSKFGTGNKETLGSIPKKKGIDVRDELLKFHNQWYSSNIMSLAILGKESLDELEKMVVEMFSPIENKDVICPSWPEHPVPEKLQGSRAYVVPIKDSRNLHISFPIPDQRELYKSAPGNYLSHLLGHEGPGSLLSALKKRGWCNHLVGGIQKGGRGFAFFGIQVDLTEEGIEHVNDIIKLVFQYVNLLRKSGPVKMIHEEQVKIYAMNFRFKDKEEPRNFVSYYSHGLLEYPMEDILTSQYLISEWRPDLIESVLDLLRPERMRIAVLGKKFESICTQEEKWYGTKYLLEKIPENILKIWQNPGFCDDLFLPAPNDFVADSFDLKAPDTDSKEFPTIIRDTPFIRVWYKQDDEFFLPKLNVFVEIDSPMTYADPQSCAKATLLMMLFRDALNEYTYPAELAGIDWSISNTKSSLSVRLEGFDSKQHVLLNKIMEKLVSFKVDHKRFDVMKEINIREIKNFAAEQPYQHGMYHLAVLLSECSWVKSELLKAVQGTTAEMVQDYIPRLLSSVHVECLIHGNCTKNQALELSELISDKLPLKNAVPLHPHQLLLKREIQLEKGSHYRFEVDHTVHSSSCILVYYQCGKQSSQTNVLLELLLQILSEPCFDILRTKEQLGYMVFSGLRKGNGTHGLRIIVQSDKHPSYVETRVEAFLYHMKDYIKKMSDEEFERHRSALAAQRLKKPKMMLGRTHIFWSEIVSQCYHFDRTKVEVQALIQITREQLYEFYEKLIFISSDDRQKLGIHVISSAEGGAGHQDADPSKNPTNHTKEGLLPVPQDNSKVIKIEDVLTFKSGRALCPLGAQYTNIPRKGTHCKL